MQYTTHFNLMLPEGTDIVNPLVQQNPNFSDIDAAMYANKQGAVGSATELTAGTVHTITRANTDSNVIKFTATSNWTAGDSMVIDSTPVSVFLSDGTAPKTGAYVINTEVFLILSGTRVTLIVSSGAPAASDVSYSNAGSGLAATNVQDAIDEIVTDELLASAVSDGVSTVSEILDSISAQIDQTKLGKNSYITLNDSYFLRIQRYTNDNIRFSCATDDTLYMIKLRASGSSEHTVAFNSNSTVTYTDLSATVPVAGITYKVYA